MLGRYPLFNGISTMEHIRQVMAVLGTLGEEDLVEFPQAAAWILNNPARGTSFERLYPQFDDHTICLLDYLLQFNPRKRPTVDHALSHIYFKPLRQNPMVIAYHEFNCLSHFDSSYEDSNIDNDEDIRLLILGEAGIKIRSIDEGVDEKRGYMDEDNKSSEEHPDDIGVLVEY